MAVKMHTTEFIKQHPENWRDLLKRPPYSLNIREDSNYAILSYSQTASDFSEPICKECRGLIIDLHTITPVALSFPKFFNYGEQYADKIYWPECKVQEKIDGSKILVWYDEYKKEWRLSTSSMLNAYEANVKDFGYSFGDIFEEALSNLSLTKESFITLLEPNYCYTFELVSPITRIVIPYKKASLYFIGVRSVFTFNEENPDEYELSHFIPRPKAYPMTGLKECLHVASQMGYNEEGFVVVDKHWNRIKIKSPAYVAAHHLFNNGVNSQAQILEIIEKNEQSEFLTYFPEYLDMFKAVEQAKTRYIEGALKAVKDLQNVVINNNILTQKDLATIIQKNYEEYSALLFTFLKTDLYKCFIESQWNKLTTEAKMKRLTITPTFL